MDFNSIVQNVGKVIDAAGIVAIILGASTATAIYARRLSAREDANAAYRLYRQAIGRAILLGLELLVAADIVRTVAATPTFESVGILVVIVGVRTFLSFSLELELNGRWPWQRPADEQHDAPL
jgi:uncharacterized membrane protein